MARFGAFVLAIAILCYGPVIGGGATVRAQEAHKLIRPSLVYLKATGQVRSGPNASEEVDTFGTGFLVSSDGLVLTTYHLLSELGDFEPRTVRIEARIGDRSENARPAAIVDASINTDLLLLKLPPASDDYTAVSLGTAYDHNDAEDIYTSGFPKSISFITQAGKIQAREGPGGSLWTTNLQFEHGQSGSPVYDDSGKVIGVVKGTEGTLNYIVPIEFADPLLTQVRLREMKQQIQKIEERLDK
jgi:S1-C subfamily serine protease